MYKLWPRTSSIYDHFDLYLTPVTLTFNLPEKMFQMALLLEGNNCAKLFWNQCINVQVIARTSSIYDHFDICLTPVTLTFNLPEKTFKWHFSFSRATTVQFFLKSMHKCTSYGPTSSIYDHFDIYLTHVTLIFNLPEKMFQMALFLLKGNNCAILFWNPCINVQVMARQAQYMTILTFIWSLWPWPSTYLKKCFKWHFSFSRATTVQYYFEIHA